MARNWRKDGIRGFDKIIRENGRIYKLWTTKDSRSKALKRADKGDKVYKVQNTPYYAIYSPYSGAERPIQR